MNLENKFFFFSNKKINNNLIIDFSIATDDKKIPNFENIDKDYYSNILKYNPYINLDYGKKIRSIIYLNIEKFQIDFTYKDMIELQDKYEKRSKIYSKDVIDEMNSEVYKYKYILMGFGIAVFAYLAIVGLCVLLIFPQDNCTFSKRDCDYDFWQDLTPMKRVLYFYLVFSPSIILSLASFPLTIIKKMRYNDLLTKEYLNEYKIDDNLELSDLYNTIEFIILLIMVIMIIFYPIIIKVTSCESKTQKKGTINPEFLQDNQEGNNHNDKQKNSDDKFDDYPENPEFPKPTDEQNSINYEAPNPIYT